MSTMSTMSTRSKRSTRRTGLALAAAVTALTATMTPAHAQTVVVEDGADATASLTDMLDVRIAHGEDEVTVRTTFPDLRRKSQASQAIYLDKNPDRPGPEHALFTPLFTGSDYALVRMRKWEPTTGPLSCRYSVDLHWRRDVARVRIDRGCLGNPDGLRVGVRMRDDADGSHPVVDWVGARRSFTDRLASGAVS